MFLLYVDFGPDGTVIPPLALLASGQPGLGAGRRVGQYVVISEKHSWATRMPTLVDYKAHSIIEHNLVSDVMRWVKNRSKDTKEVLTNDERDNVLLQLLASETW